MLLKKNTIKYIITMLTLSNLVSPILVQAQENRNITNIIKVSRAIEADTWKSGLKEKPTALDYGKAIEVDGKIYAVNRKSSSNATIEVYDPVLDEWEFKTNLPSEREDFAMSEIDGKIYFIGGEKGKGNKLNTVDIYDINTDTWTTGTNINTARSYASSVVVNKKIYLLGGRISDSNYGGIEVYDPVKNTWTNEGSMLNPREMMGVIAYDNKIYCAGGVGVDEWVNTFDVYDTITKTWEVKANILEKRQYPAIGYYDGHIYLIGGEFDTEPLYSVEEYDIGNDSWSFKKDAPWNISDMAYATVENKIYIIGGWSWESDYTNKTTVAYIMQPTLEDKAEELVKKAESTLSLEDISNAREAVNQLLESSIKDVLSDRLNSIFPQISPINTKTSTSSIDMYIVSKNALSMSLSTNNIIFDKFHPTEDMEKLNALTINIESSLPYELNASLESEITNSEGTATVNENILSLRINGSNEYKTFTSTKTPISLYEYQNTGANNAHGIDIKLNKGIISKADVYRAVIKYEVKQK